MTQDKSWAERYVALVPQKLTPEDVRVLLDLLEEDPERLFDELGERRGQLTTIHDSSWAERYVALIPQKLTPEDVRVLLELLEEDPERLFDDLEDYAKGAEGGARGRIRNRRSQRPGPSGLCLVVAPRAPPLRGRLS